MKKFLFSFIIITSALLHTFLAFGIEEGDVKGKISFGYDNNIFEQAESKTGRGFTRLYLDSKLPLLCSKRLGGVLRLQNGFKTVGKYEIIALNQVNLRLAFKISSQISSEILSELKHKSISVCSNSSVPSEYGYLKWHGGISLKFITKSNLMGNLKYFERRRYYTDLEVFDSKVRQVQFITNISPVRNLNVNFMGSWQRLYFPNLLIYEQKVKTNQVLLANPRERIDNLYELLIGFQWISKILINPNYTFQKNSSNSKEYSFQAHKFSILTALPIFWETTIQLYGCLQSRKYDSQELSPTYLPDEENSEQERDIIILNINRGLFENCSLEVRYLLSQAALSSSSKKYIKQSYSLTLSYIF